MRKVLSRRSILLTIASFSVIVLGAASAAFAADYAAVFRDPAYGVKASITTPATMPTQPGFRAHYVGRYDSADQQQNPDLFRWMQTGWCMGDGGLAPDGQAWPLVPSSYKETVSGIAHIYGLTIYAGQPLNYARSYRIERYGTTQAYMVYIQDTSRPPSLAGYPIPTVSEAVAEIQEGAHTRAGYSYVKYRGYSTWRSYDQDSDSSDNPPYASFPPIPPVPANYQFTAWNGM